MKEGEATAKSSRRGKAEIIFDILKTCEASGATKNQIVNQKGIRWSTLDYYVDYMVKNDMIRVDQPTKIGSRYIITPKGREVLRRLEDVFEII